MKTRITLISLALIGFVFAFSGSAWAGRDHHRGHYYQKWHQHDGRPFLRPHGYKRHYEHKRHYGYKKHYRYKRHYEYKRGFRWHHGRRHHFKRDYFGPRRHDRHYYHRPIEKHVYRHYDAISDRRYHVKGRWSDYPGCSFSFGISGSR